MTNDTLLFHTIHGCDSIVLYSLYVIDDTVREYFYDTICVGDAYYQHGFDIPTDATADSGTFVYRRSDTTYVALLYLTQVSNPTCRISVQTAGDSSYYLTVTSTADAFQWWSEPEDPSLIGQHNNRNVIVCPAWPTTYMVEAYYSRFPNCPSYDSVLIVKRIEGKREVLWLPNVFTPDRTDNNVFKAEGIGILEFEMSVYHRWGELVFRSCDINQGWDGTHNGIKCPSGAYVYLIYYNSLYTPQERKKRFGTVLLLR